MAAEHHAPRPLWFLEYNVALVPAGGAMVAACNAAPVSGHMKEAAGRSFHHKVLVVQGLAPLDEEEAAEDETEEVDDHIHVVTFGPGGTDDLEAWERTMRRKRKGSKVDNWDYYAMLELQDVRWRASVADLKEAFKRVSLRYHPDKCGLGFATPLERDKIEARFKLIQDAFEVLTDPAQRRMHDSTDVPEVALPTSLEAGDDFFAEFRRGFDFMERFSERLPVPQLGGPDTPYGDVDRFYTFWFAFKSWREFKHPDEEDTSVADCREQKREMERKNAKLREKAKKDETNRIAAFVEAAYENDPRVKAHEAAVKAAKDAKKLERGAAKREQEAAEAAAKAAADAKAEEEAKKAAESRESAKKDKEAQRKALQKDRKRLRTASEAAVASGRLAAGAADIETLCSELPQESLAQLAGQLEKAAGPDALAAQVEALTVAMSALQSNYRERAEKAAAKAVPSAPAPAANGTNGHAAAAAAAPWTPAEVKALEKAMKQHPVGTAKRWEVIADVLGTGRTGDAVAHFAKEHAAKASSQAGNDYESFLAARKGSADVNADGGASTRETAFTDVQVGQAPAGEDEWTEAQDLALVTAMKVHTKDSHGGDDKARWIAIAAEVQDKTAAQCVKRVAALKEAVKK